MATAKPDAHIWGQEFSRFACLSFRCNWTIFGWAEANAMFYDQNGPKSNQESYRSGSLILPKMKEIWKGVQKLLREQSLQRRRAIRYKNF